MNEYLEKVRIAVLQNNQSRIEFLTSQYADTCITETDILDFSRSFCSDLKNRLRGSININGSGGSHVAKPNISSIAAMYLARMSERRVVKTGSGAYSGLFGSSDFFQELGLLTPAKRDACLERYHFAYFDYLEISPWKRFKPIMFGNQDLNYLFFKIVFFDYESDTYFLGISDPAYHSAMAKHLFLENQPHHLITYYTELNELRLDEAAPGRLFVQNSLIRETKVNAVPILSSLSELKAVNHRLLTGTENGYWRDSLALTCALCLLKLGEAESLDDGLNHFDEAYRTQILKPMLAFLEN